eukprot:7635066-Pyramimonas_sp.AAC.1
MEWPPLLAVVLHDAPVRGIPGGRVDVEHSCVPSVDGAAQGGWPPDRDVRNIVDCGDGDRDVQILAFLVSLL